MISDTISGSFSRTHPGESKPNGVHTCQRWALAADIGGTRARFARCDLDGSNVTPLLDGLTADYPSLSDAIVDALNGAIRAPTLVSLAVAAPVVDGIVHLTNAQWSFTVEDVKDAAGTDRVQLINDFAALAQVLPRLGASDLMNLKPGSVDAAAPCVIVGSGTGLGAAGYIKARGVWTPVPSEGGHMAYGPTDDTERKVHAFLAHKHGHVSWERVLSGQGLADIEAALGGPAGHAPAEVVGRAFAKDETAAAAVRFFVAALARFAGDAALMLGAKGGVYLGGGIVPRLIDLVDEPAFREAFIDKGRMSSYLEPIPVKIITAPVAGLRGAAAALTDLLNDADRVGWAHV